MKIALAQLNYKAGDFENNILKTKIAINKAKKQNVDLIVFSELSISGYPLQDFLKSHAFIEQCDKSISLIAKECNGIAAIIGSPLFNKKKLYNSAFFLNQGEIKSIYSKTVLSDYNAFNEYYYFEPNKKFETINHKKLRIALTISDDLYDTDNINAMDKLIEQQPDIIINIAASPFNYNKKEIRKNILLKNAKKYKLPLFYVNQIGGQTGLLFDGGSMVIDRAGNIIDELNYFKEDFKVYDFDENKNISFKQTKYNKTASHSDTKISGIYDALIMGIKDYFKKSGFKKAILGLSGGIDSAVTLVLAVKALGKENVKAVLLPSAFSSEHSVKDAKKLAKNLNISYDIINIADIYDNFEDILSPYFKNLSFDITEENIQARIRCVILMAFANKFSYILLNTSNKSEAAVGYGTLYGDIAGGLSVLGDVYKTQVYHLSKYINKNKEIIPANTITKPASAELRPNQKDSDSLPDYEILDKILFQYIEQNKNLKQIIALGFDGKIAEKIIKLVNANEYKRHQAPPSLIISPKPFGTGRKMPVIAKYT
jgi:NAD+ synthase (glutamine-hydrolysing)